MRGNTIQEMYVPSIRKKNQLVQLEETKKVQLSEHLLQEEFKVS